MTNAPASVQNCQSCLAAFECPINSSLANLPSFLLEDLERYLETSYADEMANDGVQVVVIAVSLPHMRRAHNPTRSRADQHRSQLYLK